MGVNRKELGAGLVFFGVGALYLIYALKTLPVGTARSMGPGYFPVLLSSLVALIGVVVLVRSFIIQESGHFGVMPWRAMIMLTLAMSLFATLLNQLGVVLTVFMTSFLSCLATSQIKIASAAIISLGIAVFCTLVFVYAIGLQLPLLGSWLRPAGV